jgi:hypothetical protein
MRRMVAVVVLGVLVGAGVVPSRATAEQFTIEGSAIFADAFWTKLKKLDHGDFRVTVWGVFAFEATDGSFAEAGKSVFRCPKRFVKDLRGRDATRRREGPNDDCTLLRSSFGFTDLPAGGVFELDETNLETARADFTVDLTRVNDRGRPIGKGRPTQILAEWTGTGNTAFFHGESTFDEGECHASDEFDDAFRQATAQATFGDVVLPTSEGAALGRSSFRSTSENCDFEEEPLSAKRF